MSRAMWAPSFHTGLTTMKWTNAFICFMAICSAIILRFNDFSFSLSLYLSVNSFVVVELLRRNSIYIFGWHGGHTNLFFDVLALLVSAAVLGQIQHKDSELRFHRPVPLVGYSTVQQEHSTPFLVQRHTIKFVMWFDATDGGLVSICSFLLLYS